MKVLKPAGQSGKEEGAARRARFAARLGQLRGARRRSIVGVPELAGLAVAGLLLLAALFSYFYFLLPQQSRLSDLQAQRTKLQNELREADASLRGGEDTQTSVERILESLNNFEGRHLVSRERAATAVIEELNGLIRRNSLRITTGISFTQFEAVGPNAPQQQQQQQRAAGGQRPIQNIFPGVGVSLTVEGTYANLRRFVRDVEADERFLVVNTVELEGVSDSRAARAAEQAAAAAGMAPPNPTGAPPSAAAPARTTGATTVSLRLNMAAYFRRPGAGQPAEVSQ